MSRSMRPSLTIWLSPTTMRGKWWPLSWFSMPVFTWSRTVSLSPCFSRFHRKKEKTTLLPCRPRGCQHQVLGWQPPDLLHVDHEPGRSGLCLVHWQHVEEEQEPELWWQLWCKAGSHIPKIQPTHVFSLFFLSYFILKVDLNRNYPIGWDFSWYCERLISHFV